jgi:hypothetical protein
MVLKHLKHGKGGMVDIIERCGMDMQWYQHMFYGP